MFQIDYLFKIYLDPNVRLKIAAILNIHFYLSRSPPRSKLRPEFQKLRISVKHFRGRDSVASRLFDFKRRGSAFVRGLGILF